MINKEHRIFTSANLKKVMQQFDLSEEMLKNPDSYETLLSKIILQLDHVRSLALKHKENNIQYVRSLRMEGLILEKLLFVFRAVSTLHYPADPFYKHTKEKNS